jgi:glutaredoxin-dependent peroxiredoxin
VTNVPVSVGDEAPDFELPGRFERDLGAYRVHRLSEALHDGPVILHFFPLPFSSTCEEQMCGVRDSVDRYVDAGVAVWGVTTHAPVLIRNWAREHRFGIPILADYDRAVSESYVGLYAPAERLGVALCAKRGVVAVGTDGVVRHVWVADDPDLAPGDEEVRSALGSVGTQGRPHPEPPPSASSPAS